MNRPSKIAAVLLVSLTCSGVGAFNAVLVPNRFYNGISKIDPTVQELVSQRFTFWMVNPEWVKAEPIDQWKANWVKAEVLARLGLLVLVWVVIVGMI